VAGQAVVQPVLASELSQKFDDFDDAIARGPTEMPGIFAPYNFPTIAECFIVGISPTRGPEAYVFRTADDLPLGVTEAEARAAGYYDRKPFQFMKLNGVVCVPAPDRETVLAANNTGISPDHDPERVTWGLHKALQMQRSMKLPPGIGSIGGFGQVTSVYPDRIEQRIVCRWPDDEVGAPLKPIKTDWKEWHRYHPMPGASQHRRRVK
jgi:hypothetical protein